MKRGIRISLVLVIGMLLAAAGVIGLLQGPGLVQYTFQPGEETVSALLEHLDTMRESLKDSFPGITLHAQKSGRSLTYSEGASQNDVVVYAVGPNWYEAYPMQMAAGRPVTAPDSRQNAKVIVLDRETAFLFFGEGDPIGKSVSLDGTALEVIGVAEHSRRIGETDIHAAWVPLGTVKGSLMVVSAPLAKASSLMKVFESAAAENFDKNQDKNGTLISTARETIGQTMMLRIITVIFAVWLLKKWTKVLSGTWHTAMERIRGKSKQWYPLRMIPYGAAQMLLPILLTAVTIGAAYLIAVFAVNPAYVYPEWIPESLGDFSKWTARFWNLTGDAAKTVQMQTPELAEARFWGGLTQWGTVLMLAGVILTMLKSAKKGKNP